MTLPRTVIRLAVAAGLTLATAPGFAGDAPFGVAPAPPESDQFLAMKTKAALGLDRSLAGLNLIVSVVHGAAVIDGQVPDPALIPRIEAAARRVPGLASVTVKCWAAAAEDPFAKLVGTKLTAPPPAPAPVQTGVPPLVLSLPPDRVEPRPAPVNVAAKPAEAGPGTGTVTVQKLTPPATAGFLLDPVAAGGVAVRPTSQPSSAARLPMPSPASGGYPTIPPPAVPTTPESGSVSDRIAEARGRDARFAGFTVSLKGGTAVVTGTAASPDDAWTYAAVVGTIPGIERVVVGPVMANER